MSAINPDEIISILKEEIENYDEISQNQEAGTVISVGDGIAVVYGIDHAMYGEVVVFENGLKGMVQDIRSNSMGCILFGSDSGIREGTRVTRTGRQAGIPVGEGFIGRIVNALGAPVDGKGEIREEEYRPVEYPAPGIIDRKSVTVPMETGILSIDSMFPIGRGQRELIIGDRQTGKTAIAIDTIINQKGRDLHLCGHWTESFYSGKSCLHPGKAWRYGIYDGIFFHSQRLCSASVYCALCRDCSG